MLKTKIQTVLFSLVLVLLSGCTIAQTVTPAPAGTKIEKIYVQQNRNVHMDGLHEELLQQLRGLGIEAVSFEGTRPPEAVHMLSYTANWRWDMAMYLTYFQASLLEEGRVLGRAEYNATMGGARPDKFGKTAEKIRPLLIDLLQNVQRGTGSAAELGTATR